MSILRIVIMSFGGGMILLSSLGAFDDYGFWTVLAGVLLLLLAAIAKAPAPTRSRNDDAEFRRWKAQRDQARHVPDQVEQWAKDHPDGAQDHGRPSLRRD